MAWGEETHKGNGIWRGRYRAPDGDVRTVPGRTFKSKGAARKAATQYETDIARGVWHDPQAGTITFAEYYEQIWRPNKHAELQTLDTYDTTYRSALKPVFGDMQLRKILPTHVQGWVTKQARDGDNPSTILRRFRALQTVLAGRKGTTALRDGYISRNPCAGTELPTVPERDITIYPKEHVKLIVAQVDSWWQPLLMLAAETGCRWGELMGMTVADFSIGMRTVTVHRTIVRTRKKTHGDRFAWKDYPKGRKPRVLALNPAVGKMVTHLIATRGLSREDRLFSMPDRQEVEEGVFVSVPLRTPEWPMGQPVEAGYFRAYHWLPAIAAAGVPPLRFHDLRGSNLSWLLNGGLDIAQVQERAGHKQITTTQRYIKALNVDEDAIAALSDLWGGGIAGIG